ncbi:hypothetical protein SCUP234_03115 [Seiridium cupressi]
MYPCYLVIPEYGTPEEGQRSQDFCLLHEFSQQRGPTIVQEELDAHELLSRAGVTNEEVQSAIRRALDMIFEIFRESGTAGLLDNRHPSLSHPHDRDSNVQTSQPYTSGRSTTDNGLMVATSSSNSLQLHSSVSRNHINANGNRQSYEIMEAPELPERPAISWDIDEIQSNFAAGHLDIELHRRCRKARNTGSDRWFAVGPHELSSKSIYTTSC